MKFGKHPFVFLLTIGLVAGCYAMKSNQGEKTEMPVIKDRLGIKEPPSRSEQKQTILAAIKAGDLVKVTELIEADKFPVNGEIFVLYEDRRSTALVEAAKANKLDIVKYLVEKGADVNAKDKIRYHSAPGRMEIQVVRYVGHFSALDYAKQNNNAEMIKLLEASSAARKDIKPIFSTPKVLGPDTAKFYSGYIEKRTGEIEEELKGTFTLNKFKEIKKEIGEMLKIMNFIDDTRPMVKMAPGPEAEKWGAESQKIIDLIKRLNNLSKQVQ